MGKCLLDWPTVHSENCKDPGGERTARMFLSRSLLVGGAVPFATRKQWLEVMVSLEERAQGTSCFSCLSLWLAIASEMAGQVKGCSPNRGAPCFSS